MCYRLCEIAEGDLAGVPFPSCWFGVDEVSGAKGGTVVTFANSLYFGSLCTLAALA